MNKLLVSTLALTAFITLTLPAMAASDLSNNSVVMDKNGHPVRARLGGTCVRTSWEAGRDACGPAPVATKSVVHTELTDDEKSVYFAFDSDVLTPAAQMQLDTISRRLIKADDVDNAKISGHADRIGQSDYNITLSARRAAAVKDYLAAHGYLKVAIADVQAFGEESPVTQCSTKISRSEQITCLGADRRVDISLTYVDRSIETSTR